LFFEWVGVRRRVSGSDIHDRPLQVIVGVNKYTVANEEPPPVRVIDNSAVLKAQVAKLMHVKQSRDAAAAAKALDGVRAAAADSSINLLGET
jgi:methylmalonyl-CoA mutase